MTERPRWMTLTTLTVGALLLVACGDDDAGEAAIQDDPAVTTTALSETTTTDVPSDTDALVGIWAHPDSGRENTFEAGGRYLVSEADEVLAEGTWTATPTTVEIVPGSGAIACDQSATYEWSVENNTLTLTAVVDECPGRRSGLDGVTRHRVE